MFQGLMERVREEVVGILFRIQISTAEQVEEMKQKEKQSLNFSHADGSTASQPLKRQNKKVKRNDPCPCGSGKKYKKCCMK